MKALAILLCLSAATWAQSDAIKATARILPDGSTLTTITNPENRTREETITQANGKVVSKTTYTLNEQNFAIAASHLDAKGAVRYKEVFAFDAAGRIIESKLFSASNQSLGRRVFIYDTNVENQARVVDYDANGVVIARAQSVAPRASKPDKKKR